MNRTVADLIAEVPVGEARFFKAPIADAVEEHYVEVAYNHDYGSPIGWNNPPPPLEGPWMGARVKPRVGLSGFADPDLSTRKNLDKLVDFYTTTKAARIISAKLLNLIEAMDPNSLEIRPVTVKARNGSAEYYFVMPIRNVSAIDVSRTDVKIYHELLITTWIRKVKFPNNVIFDKGKLTSVHNFSDIDLPRSWFWSQALVDRAKAEGVKGLYTYWPGSLGKSIEYL